MDKQYDYLIVGAGIYGATFACMAHRQGKRCLVIDKRSHLGGTSIVRISKVSMSISMALIFSIHQIKRFGNL